MYSVYHKHQVIESKNKGTKLLGMEWCWFESNVQFGFALCKLPVRYCNTNQRDRYFTRVWGYPWITTRLISFILPWRGQ
jgi:hypothetical protein